MTDKTPLLRWVGGVVLMIGIWFTGYWAGSRPGGKLAQSINRTEVSDPTKRARLPENLTASLDSSAAHSDGARESRAVSFAALDARLRSILGEANPHRRTQLLTSVLDQLGPASFSVVADLALQLPDEDRIEMLSLLVNRWVAVDPRAAANLALTQSNYWHGDEVMQSALGAWVAADSAAALAWMKALPKGHRREKAMEVMVTVLARTQPAAALQLMEGSPTLKMQHLHAVMGQMALQDPHAAMALAEQLPKGKDGDRAAGAAMWVLARDDPAAALAWARGLTDPARKRTALSNAFAAWAGVAPEAAQQQALALAGEERDAAMSAVVRMTVDKDPDQALRLAAQITSPNGRDSALFFLTRGLLDAVPPQPERAVAAIAAMSPGERHDSVTRWIAETWASTDLDGARSWVSSLPPGEGRREAIQSVVNEWGEKDAREALSWYLKNEPPTGDSSGVEHLLGQWIARDETGALGYLRGLPDGRAKDMLLSEAIESAATREAPHAAQLLTTILSADAQRLAAAGVARSWAESDPAAAANWATTLSEPQASARACEVIAAAWAKRDFVKTTAWLDGLPAGEARDAAITSFTQVASGIDAQGALAWAGAVADPAQRDTVTEKLLQSWITRDAMAARQWLQASETVSPAVRTRMLAFRP